MTINPRQIQTVKVAQRSVGMSDAHYRLLLRNVAHADSCKQLDNAGFEDVMAHFEELGFRMTGRPSDYFRNKVKLRGTFAGERVVFKIRELAAGTPYAAGLPGLCERFSHGRTRELTKLHPTEAHNLVEMLKAAGTRAEKSEGKPRSTSTQLPGDAGGDPVSFHVPRSYRETPALFPPSSFIPQPSSLSPSHGGDSIEEEPF